MDLQAVGLVVEYNPFHNGHFHHVQEAKRQTGAEIAVAVMSGQFYSVESLPLSINGHVQKWPWQVE